MENTRCVKDPGENKVDIMVGSIDSSIVPAILHTERIWTDDATIEFIKEAKVKTPKYRSTAKRRAQL